MEGKDTIKFGIVVLLIAFIAMILASGVTYIGQNSFSYLTFQSTNLSDNNTANIPINCTQQGVRYFNITNSIDSLGDMQIGDICFYNYTNVTLAVYYDNVYKDNFTLNCSNITLNTDVFPVYQVNVTNGIHFVNYTTNLCYDNIDTNDTIQLNITNGSCSPARLNGSQCLIYNDGSTRVYPNYNNSIEKLIAIIAIIVVVFVILYIANEVFS